MPRSVLLRHDLPDGSWHYDWLIDALDKGGQDDRNLITFRLAERPDGDRHTFDATRLPDHRRLYLAFEGELSEHRGTITKIEEWPCTIRELTPTVLHLSLGTPKRLTSLRGSPSPHAPSTWRFARD